MEYDVIIAGGSLAGTATATMLLQREPDLRILVLEKSPRFTRRVGEATVEVSGYFLGRVLGLTRHLNDCHIVKQGMRFWFSNEQTHSMEDAGEIGGRFQARLPAYQVDRSVLDEELLGRVMAAGAEVRRPANVRAIRLEDGGCQRVTYEYDGHTETATARWVVDASGVAALLARQEGWLRTNAKHPISACWARWRGVKDWDGLELAKKFPKFAEASYGVRGTATNHVFGRGWWSWWIPLKGGDLSVGVVFDQRLVEWPRQEGELGGRLKDFLMQHPVAAEMLERAEPVEGDVHWRKNLAYSSTTYAGDGFSLVGDAAAFLDPFYSPGLDWMSYTVNSTVELILTQRRGGALAKSIARHQATFERGYWRWFEAIYQDKYEYLGEFDLMKIAFPLDLGLYYLGVASQPYKFGLKAFMEPPFTTPTSAPFFHLMRTYNRGLAAIARKRARQGTLGRMNSGRRYLIKGFTFGPDNILPLLGRICGWLTLSVVERIFPSREKITSR
jgi:flavin-dependent dehydrogenase